MFLLNTESEYQLEYLPAGKHDYRPLLVFAACSANPQG